MGQQDWAGWTPCLSSVRNGHWGGSRHFPSPGLLPTWLLPSSPPQSRTPVPHPPEQDTSPPPPESRTPVPPPPERKWLSHPQGRTAAGSVLTALLTGCRVSLSTARAAALGPGSATWHHPLSLGSAGLAPPRPPAAPDLGPGRGGRCGQRARVPGEGWGQGPGGRVQVSR